MDTITQGLLGAVTAQLGFRQRIGREATWVATIAAVVPDLDIFIMPLLSLAGVETGSFTRARIHRGLSHSLLMTPLIALAITGLWWWLRKSRDRKGAGNAKPQDPPPPSAPAPGAPSFRLLYACVFLAVLSHPLLDWCTSYGTQLLAPISGRRLALDAAPIIDFIYTPILIVTLAACFLVRKLTRGGGRRATLVIGWAGMLLSVGYLAAGRGLHDWAAAKARKLAGDERVLRADAYPWMGTIFLWRAVVETEDRWLVSRLHFFGNPGSDNAKFGSAAKVDNDWVRRARREADAETFDWFAMGRVRADYARRDGMHVVEFHDMRYGRRPESTEGMWVLRVTFDESGRLLGVERAQHFHGRDMRQYAAETWAEIWNP